MIIVYGGSFDPPHIGHCGIVSQLKKTYPFAFRIYIVPNFISPFKTDKSLSKEIIWKLYHRMPIHFEGQCFRGHFLQLAKRLFDFIHSDILAGNLF